jgi:hypothetical protein
MTGVRTKSAASRIRRVLMDAVMIDVRRVVGRENSNSQTTSLLPLACGWGSEWVKIAWRSNGAEGTKKRLLASFGVVDVDWSFFSEDDELAGGSGDRSERRGARGTVAM